MCTTIITHLSANQDAKKFLSADLNEYDQQGLYNMTSPLVNRLKEYALGNEYIESANVYSIRNGAVLSN